MNCVHLIGRLATDIDLRESNTIEVASAIIAVDRNEYEADFFRLKSYGPNAKRIYEAAGGMAKGRRIAVRGKLRQDIYEKDGEERKAVSVHVDEFELL
jgi:single-stranded DNA-binding protein